MTITDGNIPLYFQFYLTLKNEILIGDRQPGERIPTIEELHQEYGVSQITIRKALVLLDQAGLITKKQRRGIYVRQDLARVISEPSKSYSDMIDRLKPLRRRVISSEWIAPPRRIAFLFKEQPGAFRDGRIFRTRRIWISRKESWRRRLTNVYVPANLYDEIAPDGQTDLVVLDVIFSVTKYASMTIKGVETLQPWICDVESAKALNIPDGTPVFHRTWKHYTPDEELLWMSESLTTASFLIREVWVGGPKEDQPDSR